MKTPARTPDHGGRGPVRCALCQASPSLALIKYWGKSDPLTNSPATASLAISLSELRTETRVWAFDRSFLESRVSDYMVVDGKIQEPQRFEAYFDGLRAVFGEHFSFWAESTNNFPGSAGLASSSSGFAALTLAAARACGKQKTEPEVLSSLARLGSASAARAVFGGFTLLPAGAEHAHQVHEAAFWPELRVVIVRVESGPKGVSSRQAMERARLSSPYYEDWVADSRKLCNDALSALDARDLDTLGPLIRKSYLRMFATMISSDPPVLYWRPGTLGVLQLCESLRASGLGVWETMDAGPQVKILCLERDTEALMKAIRENLGIGDLTLDSVGQGPRILDAPVLLGAPHQVFMQAAVSLGISLPIAEKDV